MKARLPQGAMTHGPRRQRGSATLVISLILLFTITLVTLYTTRSTIMEQNISANEARSGQAVTAAQAGIDAAVAWFNSGEWNVLTAPAPGRTPAKWTRTNFPLTNALGYEFEIHYCAIDTTFNTTPLACTAPTSETDIGIVSVGYSDDGAARRVLVQKVGAEGVIPDGGPGSSVSTRGGASVTGNITLINRYTNTTVWSGGTANIGNSASAGTFLRDPRYAVSSLTRAELTDEDPTSVHTIPASSQKQGNNSDIIENDPNIGNVPPEGFFKYFFNADKGTMESKAIDNGARFTAEEFNALSSAALAALSGTVWIDGDISLPSTAIGSLDAPVILIVDGNLRTRGGEITGLLYSTGNWDTAGNVVVKGAAVVEGQTTAGAGVTKVIYDPKALEEGGKRGGGGGVAGSWRDFGS